jgi:uroporphyrinogen-III decarboxylase
MSSYTPYLCLMSSPGVFSPALQDVLLPSEKALTCSDILTPLPALGVPFEIDDAKGPIIANPIRTMEEVRFDSHSCRLLTQLAPQKKATARMSARLICFQADGVTYSTQHA